MTPEQLEKLMIAGQPAKLAAAVADLSEPERKKLSKTAQSVRKDIERALRPPTGEVVAGTLQRLKEFLGARKVEPWEQMQTANLAVLAVGPLSQAKRVHIWWHHVTQSEQENPALKIMRDRRPEWIDDWIAAALAGNDLAIDWETLWGLIQDGVCQKPTSDDYYRALPRMLGAWSGRRKNSPIPLSEYLASQPALLDDVWKLFEVDTDAFAYDWVGDGAPRYESWPTAILRLAERGHLDRGRLLDVTLAGQTTGFKQYILGGFAKLHENLAPTPDELAARQSVYCDLMSAHLPRVVAFAVKMIKKLDQSKRLDDAAFVAAAAPVFGVTTKGSPKAVIGLLKKAARRQPDLAPRVDRVMIEALNHPTEDVQGAALDWFAARSASLDRKLVAAIAERLDDLPATLRPRAAELMTKVGSDVAAVSAPEPAADLPDRLADCRRRAEAVGPAWRAKAGVDDALASMDASRWAPPLDFAAMQVPVLSGLEPVVPIASLEELIDAVAHGIEKVDAAIEVERILDGIGRLCDQKPADFERRVAPLIKRIEKTKNADHPQGIANPHIGPRELSRLVGAWLAGDADLAKPQWGGRNGVDKDITYFINARLAELRRRVEIGKPAPLLALPTHRRGWIDPRVLVARWQESERLGATLEQFEVVQALLRLAPDGRAAALDRASVLTHPWARALQWGLGGDEGPRRQDAADANIWLAAGRARSARGLLAELSEVGLEQSGPDAMEPARYSWLADVRELKDRHQKIFSRAAELVITAQPAMSKQLTVQQGRPTVVMHAESNQWRAFEVGAPWLYDWISMVWPANLDGFFAAGIRSLIRRLDHPSSTWEPNHVFLSPLFDVDRPWNNVAQLLAIIGIAGRDQDVRGLAVDALVEAIADGRVHPEPLGQTLATLTAPYWLKLNRLCDNLAEIARVSPLHTWTIAGALATLLAAYQELPRDVHYLLALLQELHAQLGLPLPDAAAASLKEVAGSSKTATLARSLIAFAPQQPTAECDEARLMTLEARLDRAERWGGYPAEMAATSRW